MKNKHTVPSASLNSVGSFSLSASPGFPTTREGGIRTSCAHRVRSLELFLVKERFLGGWRSSRALSYIALIWMESGKKRIFYNVCPHYLSCILLEKSDVFSRWN